MPFRNYKVTISSTAAKALIGMSSYSVVDCTVPLYMSTGL